MRAGVSWLLLCAVAGLSLSRKWVARAFVGPHTTRRWLSSKKKRPPPQRITLPPRTEATAADEELSPLVKAIAPSTTIEIHALTMRLREMGEEVISLSVGEPDFAPPTEVLEATAAAARSGETRYTAVTGTKELREAVATYLKEKKGTAYDAADVVVTNGAKQAVYEAVLAACGPGDEVVIPKPYWVSYPEIVKMAGATPVFVETFLDDGYKLKPENLRKVLTRRTKMVVLCNPCNPTGACLDEAELKAIDDVLDDNIWVLADEIYERLYYDDDATETRRRRAPSFAAVSEKAKNRSIIVNGFSKAFGMTGYRLGYLAAPAALAKAAAKIQGQITSCASSVSQAAGVAALKLDDAALDGHVANFKSRRDFVLRRLAEMAHKTRRLSPPPEPPGGAFYVLPEVDACFGMEAWPRDFTMPHYIIDGSTSFCGALLQNRKLALVPGDAFGAPNAIRISYAASQDTLEQAMDALEAFLYQDLYIASYDDDDEDLDDGSSFSEDDRIIGGEADYPSFGPPNKGR